MRKLIVFLAVLFLLTGSAVAYEIPEDFTGVSMEDVIPAFIESCGLTEDSISVSYYNTVTGESYSYHDTKIMPAAGTFLIPLNLYFYDLEYDGILNANECVGTFNILLSNAREISILASGANASAAMIGYFSSFRDYRDSMKKYVNAESQTVDASYYNGSNYSTAMMLNALRYLYDNSNRFEQMLDLLKDPVNQEYFKRGVGAYASAGKSGMGEGCVSDAGIIYASQPFLLAVTVYSDYGADHCKTIAALATAYTDWKAQEQHTIVEEETVPTEETVTEDAVPVEETVSDPAPETSEKDSNKSADQVEAQEQNEQTQMQRKLSMVEKMKASQFPWWILCLFMIPLLIFLLRFL